jgi:uncharacterized protein YbjT (DUF2867 family)
MTNNHRTVFVTGATGKQGGSVVRHILGRGWRLRALTRDPGSRAARVLADQGVQVVQGDLEDPASYEPALRGVYGVYSVQDFWTVGAKREAMQGKNLADAAKKARVEHFVYSSVGGVERNSGIDHFESKWEIEKHIRKLGLPATILRPVAFMEGCYSEPLELAILQGKLVHPIRADKTFQTIATDDIGGFVAVAFERSKEFIGMELEIAGSELTNPQAAEVFSRVLGKPVEFVPMPMSAEKEYSQMFNWFNDAGFQANIAHLRKQYPEVRLQTLEEWLYNEGWHKRVRRITPPQE